MTIIVKTAFEIPLQEWVEELRAQGDSDDDIVRVWNEDEQQQAEMLAEAEADRLAEENRIEADKWAWVNGKQASTYHVGEHRRDVTAYGDFDPDTSKFDGAAPNGPEAMFNWCVENVKGDWLMGSQYRYDDTDAYHFSFVDELDFAAFRLRWEGR